MEDSLFSINNFNIVQDEENYYFFRALNMADNSDIEQEITMSSDGKIERIRTDRERFDGETKYTEDSSITLEEVYDHIKMHYRKDTNCVSLTSNANIAINYGRGSYKDKYVMIKIPKKEFGEQTIEAGQYMLQELYLRIMKSLDELQEDLRSEILDIFSDIDVANETKELQEIIAKRYTSQNGEMTPSKAHPRKGISYSSPKARISSYQSLDEGQLLEVNKVYAKLAVLENEEILKRVIPHSSNSKLRETIGNAFSSSELIHYGEIKQSEILEIPKEAVDLFALIQQIDGIDKSKVEEIKRALLVAIQSGKEISLLPEIDFSVKDNISVEEMYELTGGTVEYGKANSIAKNVFYLGKARQNAIKLAECLKKVLGADSRFDDVIEYIRENGFRIEPEIISRQSGKGVKLSEPVNLNLSKDEQVLIDEIKNLSSEELEVVLQNGGLSNVQDIISRVYGNTRESEQIEKSRYYAEAIVSQYDWAQIGIEEFKISEKNELIKRLQERNCIEVYEKLKQVGIDEKQISTVLLNIVTRQGFFEQYRDGKLEELLSTRQDVLQNGINIELVERFLGYYDVENTGIRLKDYQQRAYDNVNNIFEDHKFAQVILPTGAGKSFVALAQMQKYAVEHLNEKMLYLAPQDEILNQIKSYVIKYVHGKQNTVGKTEDEIIKEVFPNITFETYSGLLAKRGQEVIKEQYGMIVLDELHRTGAKEWEGKIDTLLESQNNDVKVLGITATPVRDVDGRDMAEETAKKLGYTDEEVKQRKHLASNMTLENAIRMGYVVNPKLVYCKYDLISSGKMDELRAKIDDIEDETKRAEELQKYNELRQKLNKEIDTEIGEEARKKLEDEARRNLDSGIGKEEILRQNVKKGGKYIVFIPVTDQGEIEDEDGNRIGTKTGEDKIRAYQEYLNKVFEGTDIIPRLHSLLGSYSKDKNKEEVEAFESDKSEDTKFMVVMNKANEGLHIDGVDGIIWFRALDENSRILYLQQLGRAIYALDEDNPLLDNKRPVVIDLANNSLTVKIEKEFENSEPIDDLEALTIVIEWINEHDGMIPNRESSNKQEQHYYAVLRKIQAKYSKYLDGFDKFSELDDEEKHRIQEIIYLASEIDLWNIDLPPIPKTRGNKEVFDPFTIEGVLRDYVEIQEEVNSIPRNRIIAQFINVCTELSKQNFDFEGFIYTKTIECNGKKMSVFKTLQDIKNDYPDIDIERILQKTGVDINYPIGKEKTKALLGFNGKGGYAITLEEKQRLVELGIAKLEKESSVSRLISVCTELSKQNFDFNKFVITKQIEKDGKKKSLNKTLQDIKNDYPHIDIEKIMQITGVDINYPIGSGIYQARAAAKGYSKSAVTDEEISKLISLGVVKLNKKNSMAKLVEVCELLKECGFNFSEYAFSKKIIKDGKKKQIKKTLRDIQDECPNIDIFEIIKKVGVSIDYPIGQKISTAYGAFRQNSETPISDEQKEKLINLGVIELQRQSSISKFVEVCESLKKQNFDFYSYHYQQKIIKDGKKITIYKTLEDIKKEFPNIDVDKIMEETGVDINYSIGMKKNLAKAAACGNGTTKITEEEVQKLINLGVLNKEYNLQTYRQKRDIAKSKNKQSKELEEQVSEQIKKRGNTHEKQ